MRIAIIGQAVRRELNIGLARMLKQRYGAEVRLYSPSANSLDWYRSQANDAFDAFVVSPSPYFMPRDLPPISVEDVHRQAKDYEAAFGIPLNWLMAVDRVNGLGYSPGGFYFPRSRGNDHVRYDDVLRGYLNFFDFWRDQIEKNKFDLLLNGYNFEYFPFKAAGIPMRTLHSARYRNYYFWSENCYGELPGLKDEFDREPSPDVLAPVVLDDAPILNRKQLDALVKRGSVISLARRVSRLLMRWAMHKVRPQAKSYKISSELRYALTEWWSLLRLRFKTMPSARDLDGRKYVFYALQVEPEQNFQGFSPEYFYQLSAIISLSRDLPPDTLLVVKEHIPALNRRPDRFYDQIKLLKNVILADPRENGLALVKKAAAVATINGTVGQEAASLGIPVISFGRRNLYNILDHVTVITDEAALAPALRKALAPDFDRAKARADGARYLAALRALSVDMADFGYHNKAGATQAVFEDMADSLMRSLNLQQPAEHDGV